MVADGCHHGKCEHDHGDMAVPSMPGPCLIVIEAEFIFGGFEAVFNGPATTFDQDQFFHRRALGTPCREEGEITIGNVATDQQSSGPKSGERGVILVDIEIGQLEIGPIIKARALGTFTRRQTPPSLFGKVLCDRLGATANM